MHNKVSTHYLEQSWNYSFVIIELKIPLPVKGNGIKSVLIGYKDDLTTI